MFTTDDSSYYAEREATARRLAREAADPAARHAHLRMAAEYRRLAAEARKAAATSPREAPIMARHATPH
jgi:hypothetical protein